MYSRTLCWHSPSSNLLLVEHDPELHHFNVHYYSVTSYGLWTFAAQPAKFVLQLAVADV